MARISLRSQVSQKRSFWRRQLLIGYARISKADGSQSLDLQRDALREAGISDDAKHPE